MAVTTEKHERARNRWRFPWALAAMAIAPLCLGLLSVAARSDLARSGVGGPPDSAQEATSPPADVDPDWAVVQEYLDLQNAWMGRARGLDVGGLSDEERGRRVQEAFAERPDIRPAIAAANAIIDAGDEHGKATEAAEFLVMQTFSEPDADRHISRGAQVLLARAPHDDRWPAMLRLMDGLRFYGPDGRSSARGIDRFFEEMASGAGSPALRATARYYVASGLMRSANGVFLDEEERDDRRQRALDVADGLSAGVEEQPFDDAVVSLGASVSVPSGPFGAFTPRSLAEAEADLIRTIRHATAGGTALDMTGRRLAGTEDSLSAYRGRVVLINFWATWCPPCIDVLPELRDLVAELPAHRFTLLAISVDEQLETVNALREREPLPWANWHVGSDSDIVRNWDIRSFPTYVLVDEEGLILARQGGFDDWFTARIREAVMGEDARQAEVADGDVDTRDVDELRRDAGAGDLEAHVRLGDLYQRGDGVEQDDAEAVAWFHRAAEQGHGDAQFRLGFAYSNGAGVALDYAEAVAWFHRAAEQGHDAAQWILGSLFYFHGRGDLPRDDVQAAMWLYLALSQNDGHDRSPLDMLETRMTPAQIAEAQRLASEWREAHGR